MALQGTLDTFALADLVRLLATTTKTGELSIDGDRGSGRLWFVDGDLVGGDPGGAENALFALLRLSEGTFHFAPDSGPAEPVEALDALDVLAGAEARLEAWRPVEALVPTLDVTLALRPELEADEVTIDRDAWRRLLVAAPGTTARAFAAALGLDEVDAALAVKDLADRGLVEVGPAEAVTPEAVTLEVAVEAVAPEAAELEVAPVVDATPEVDAAPEVAGTGSEPAPVAPVDILPAGDPFAPAPEPVAHQPEPVAHDPFAAIDASLAVDLDDHLGAAADAHRYLGGEASALPEALPGLPEPEAPWSFAASEAPAPRPEPVVDPVSDPEPDPVEAESPAGATADDVVAEEPRPAWPAPAMDEDDLALQLEALSPAAARAVAAAASAEAQEPEDADAGRRVLRRIISSGRG